MKRNYITPSIEVEEVAIEKGFAVSHYGYAEEGCAGDLTEGETFEW